MTEAKGRLLGQLDPRLRGHKTHLCAACDFPIAVYGRCAPCLHVYCLTCAAGMAQCMICRALITKLERIPAEAGLYISPLTLQGYRTEADLVKHVQQLDAQLQQLLAAGAGNVGMGGAAGLAGLAGQPPPPPGAPPGQPRPTGWKPPPPPLPPGGLPGYGPAQQQRHQREQQPGQQRQGGRPPGQQQHTRHGTGAIMRP